jgi:hypothetical protein
MPLRRCALQLAFLCLLSLTSAPGAQIVWTNTAGGNFSDGANWSPNQVPGVNDTAVITSDGTYTVTLDVSPTVGGILLGATSGSSTQTLSLSGQTLTLNGPATVNSRGSFTVDSGALAGAANATLSGTIAWTAGTLAGTLTVANNGTLNVSGGSDHNMPNCIVTNLGTVAWTGGRIRGGSTSIYNLGLWDAQSDQVINNDYGGNGTLFSNAGTLRKSAGTGATSLLGGVSIGSTGVLDVQSGAIAFQGAAALPAAWSPAPRAWFSWSRGPTPSTARSRPPTCN